MGRDHRYYKLLSRSSRSAAFTTTVTEPTISKVFLYRYGLVYEPTSSLALYYGHDEGYLSVPSYFMFDGSRLRPESGLNNEVGVKLNFFKALGGSFSGSLAYFRLEVTDKWRADPLHPGYYLQDGLQKNNGFDGQLMYESPRLSGLVGLYTGDGPTVAFTGVRANIVPKQTFVSWLKFNVTDRFSVGGGYRHQGDTLNIYGTAGGEAYGTCDLFATYTMNQHPLKRRDFIRRIGEGLLASVFTGRSATGVHSGPTTPPSGGRRCNLARACPIRSSTGFHRRDRADRMTLAAPTRASLAGSLSSSANWKAFDGG